jgi:hypothetical protein
MFGIGPFLKETLKVLRKRKINPKIMRRIELKANGLSDANFKSEENVSILVVSVSDSQLTH